MLDVMVRDMEERPLVPVITPGLSDSERKQQFSLAFLHAITTVAGAKMNRTEVDDDSIDVTVQARGFLGGRYSPMIQMQLKCSSSLSTSNGVLRISLKKKNYDDLRHERVAAPRLLVVVLVPKEVDSWLQVTPDSLTLRRTGFWHSLRGYGESPNTTKVTVEIPTSQHLTPDALVTLLTRAGSQSRIFLRAFLRRGSLFIWGAVAGCGLMFVVTPSVCGRRKCADVTRKCSCQSLLTLTTIRAGCLNCLRWFLPQKDDR